MKLKKRLVSESKEHHARFRAIESWRRLREERRKHAGCREHAYKVPLPNYTKTVR